jgi:hypothetical protein
MLNEYKRDYSFFTMTWDDTPLEVRVLYYYPGTNFPITSFSLEPNDLAWAEYEVFTLDENKERSKQVYDDDSVYDPEEIMIEIQNIENEVDY